MRIAPRFVALGSEPVTEGVRTLTREAWSVECGEYYGTTELPLVAAGSASHPSVLELTEDLAVIEVVDEANCAVAPGTPGAKLLITNLANRALPLIRYELTDRVTVSPEPNPTGRPYAHLAGIDGRAADILTFPGRSGEEVDVVPLRFSAAFARLAAVGAHQVVLHRDALELRVVLGPGAPPDAPETIAAAVRAALADAGAVPPPITVTPVPSSSASPATRRSSSSSSTAATRAEAQSTLQIT